MAWATTLDRGWWELANERAPHARSAIYRVGLALQAAGIAEDDADAQLTLHEAARAVAEHTPVREALEAAGVDVAAVERHLALVERAWAQQKYGDELEEWRAVSREIDSWSRRPKAVS